MTARRNNPTGATKNIDAATAAWGEAKVKDAPKVRKDVSRILSSVIDAAGQAAAGILFEEKGIDRSAAWAGEQIDTETRTTIAAGLLAHAKECERLARAMTSQDVSVERVTRGARNDVVIGRVKVRSKDETFAGTNVSFTLAGYAARGLARVLPTPAVKDAPTA